MELNLPKHGCDGFSIDSKEDSNKSNDVSIDLISGDFHIVDIIIDNTYKNRANWADSVYDVKREIKLWPCEYGSVECEDKTSEEKFFSL